MLAATDKKRERDVVAFTVRISATDSRRLDEKRKSLSNLFGIPVSRQAYILYACQTLWGDSSHFDRIAPVKRRRAGQ